MRFNVAEILAQFGTRTKLLALLILVIAGSYTLIYTTLINSEGYNCSNVIQENLRLQEDFAKVSELARKLQLISVQRDFAEQKVLTDSFATETRSERLKTINAVVEYERDLDSLQQSIIQDLVKMSTK